MGPALQNQLNTSAQAQVQAQAMMNMQPQQMGRGMGQQGFQQMQRPMQMPNMNAQQHQYRPPQQQPQPQQQPMPPGLQGQQFQQQQPQLQQQQQQQHQQQQQRMAMAMGQTGRGMGPNPQMMGMQNGQARPGPPPSPADISRFGPGDRNKVREVALTLMSAAPEEQKNQARNLIQGKLHPQHLQDLQNQGRDPVEIYYQQHAVNILTNNLKQQAARNQLGQQNQNVSQPQPPQAQSQMMQQQQSQQSYQQPRQNIMNTAHQGGPEFPQIPPTMESIKDQQMNGFMAQKAGQMVVPVSSGAPRANAGSQPMAQSMSSQSQNQAALVPQQPPQQPHQGQPQPQPQQQEPNMHQMKMSQAQQSQAQLQAHAQMKMQGPQPSNAGMGTSQSPAMSTLNTPVARPASGMNQRGVQGPQSNAPFGNPQFNQGAQRLNNPQAYNAFLASMTPEQRQHANQMSQAQLQDVMKRWQQARPDLGMNGAAQPGQNQMANRQAGQLGQMNGNRVGQPQQGMQQAGNPNGGNQQQRQLRMPTNSAQAQAMMDGMELPPLNNLMAQLGQLPPNVKSWADLKAWAAQNNVAPQVKTHLIALQRRQFQAAMHKRKQQLLLQQQQQQQQPPQGQNMTMNPGMTTPNGQMQQQNMQRVQIPQQPPLSFTQVTPGEMQQIRNSKPQYLHLPDDQVRQIVLSMKRTLWQQQLRQAQAQAGQPQAQGPHPGFNNAAPVTQPQIQQQNALHPSATPQQPHGQAPVGPTGQKTPAQQPTAGNQKPVAANNRGGKKGPTQATPSPAQGGKNLKRPNPDAAADVTPAASGPQRKGSQQAPQKNIGQGMPALTTEDHGNMGPEQLAKYEQMRAMGNGGQGPNQMAAQNLAHVAGQGAGQIAAQNPQAAQDNVNMLKAMGLEESRAFNQREPYPDIPMSPDVYAETADKLRRIVVDMGKIARGLGKWYSITKDNERARMFFRMVSRLATADTPC
jgi:hypothetical protein